MVSLHSNRSLTQTDELLRVKSYRRRGLSLSVVITRHCPHANRKLPPVLMQAALMKGSGSHFKKDAKVRGRRRDLVGGEKRR